MTILEAIVLGVLQGITEFLPVSSSGHLVLMQHFLGIKESQVFFDVMLHFGTLGAVIIVYYQIIGSLMRTGFSTLFQADFYRHARLTISNTPDLKLIWFLLLGSIPTGLIALLFKDSLEAIFGKPMVVAGMLIITGLILQLSRLGQRQRQRQTETPLRAWHTPLVGVVQGLAIIPGISRSGSTISISLLLGLSPQVAAQYSFLLSIPAILGAVSPQTQRYRGNYNCPSRYRRWNIDFIHYRLYRVALSARYAQSRKIFYLLLLLLCLGDSRSDVNLARGVI